MEYQNEALWELVMDHSFQQWVKNPDQYPSWNERLKNPGQRGLMHKAREILLSMDFESKSFGKAEKEQLWRKIEESSSLPIDTNALRSEPRPNYRLWLRVAAGLALLLCITTVYYLFFKHDLKHSLSASDSTQSYTEKVNPRGIKSSFRLSDGSKIKLNAESTLRIPEKFSDKERLVYLEGEAFFEVAEDQLRPFIIITKSVATEVLGTSFNIRAFPEEDQVKVAVMDGQVKVSQDISLNDTSQTLSALLVPNEMASVDKTHITKSVFDRNAVFAWKDNTIYIDNLKFEAVVRKLERWYGVDFTVTRPGGIPGRFNGRFSSLSLEKVLEGLSYSSEFQYKIDGKTIIIE